MTIRITKITFLVVAIHQAMEAFLRRHKVSSCGLGYTYISYKQNTKLTTYSYYTLAHCLLVSA